MKGYGFGLALTASLVVGLVACGNDEVAGGVTDIGNSIAFTGTVKDENGASVAMARVVAYYDNWNQTSIADSVVTTANDLGEFSLQVDSGATVVLFASASENCGLAKAVDANVEITIGSRKHLKSSLSEKNSGYMRVVGSGLKANVNVDGSFEIGELPPGDISLVYVESETAQARLDFTTVGTGDSLVIPALEKRENNKDWLTITDYRYYADPIYGGISVSVPTDVEVPVNTAVSEVVKAYIPRSDESLDGIVVPVRVPTKNFENPNVSVWDANGQELSFDVDYWNEEEALLWVRLESVSGADTAITITVTNTLSTMDGAFDLDGNVLAALHLNGDSKILDHDFSEAASAADSVGLFGAGITLKEGQFIDLDYMDPCVGDFTLSLWTKWNGPNGRHQVLFSQREYWSDSTSRFQWHYEGVSNWFMVLKSMPGYPQGINLGDSTIVPQGEWSYLTLVSKDHMVSMYVNGNKISWMDDNDSLVTAQEFIPNNLSQAVPFRIGGDEISSESWNGAIDEIRVERIARSEAWIKASYESQLRVLQ